jgi:16S rRNA (cytosine967-C5)-methyltransferase
MKYDNQLRYAADIVKQYDGRVPLSAWLKDFFRVNKQMGSRDRKTVSEMVYGYYRLGRNEFGSIEERIVAYLMLSNNLPEIAEYFKEKYPSTTPVFPEKIFPYNNELSNGINAEAFGKSFLKQPDLFLRIRPDHRIEVISKLKGNNIPFQLCGEHCVALANATKVETILEINKEVVVQDKSSQETGELLKKVSLTNEHPRVWDCCAASGGKSIMAYDILNNIELTVSDIRESIIENLKKRFNDSGINDYHAMVTDLTKQQAPAAYYDLIIADVPCSGSGTWARTPEQLHFFKKEKIKFYSDLQKQITSSIISSLKPGGYLLYITCSVFAEENEHIVEQIKAKHHLVEVSSQLFKGYNDRADTLFAALLTKQPS